MGRWSNSDRTISRQNISGIRVEGVLFFAAHEVDVELSDADLPKGFQLFAVGFYWADDAEAVDDFVADEIGVVATDFAVV